METQGRAETLLGANASPAGLAETSSSTLAELVGRWGTRVGKEYFIPAPGFPQACYCLQWFMYHLHTWLNGLQHFRLPNFTEDQPAYVLGCKCLSLIRGQLVSYCLLATPAKWPDMACRSGELLSPGQLNVYRAFLLALSSMVMPWKQSTEKVSLTKKPLTLPTTAVIFKTGNSKQNKFAKVTSFCWKLRFIIKTIKLWEWGFRVTS